MIEALHPRENRIVENYRFFFADVECLMDLRDWEATELHLNDCSFYFDAKHTKANLMLFTRGGYFVPRALV